MVMLSGKLRKGGRDGPAFRAETGRTMKRAAIIIFLAIAAILGAAKVADYYLSTTCISGFGSFNDACLIDAR
jgi:hypothetical protein